MIFSTKSNTTLLPITNNQTYGKFPVGATSNKKGSSFTEEFTWEKYHNQTKTFENVEVLQLNNRSLVVLISDPLTEPVLEPCQWTKFSSEVSFVRSFVHWVEQALLIAHLGDYYMTK